MQHNLKTVQPFFDQIKNGDKNFELRKNDRGFRVGDSITLQEYEPGDDSFSGEEIEVEVTYVLCDRVGLAPDYCIFGFKKHAPQGTNDQMASPS